MFSIGDRIVHPIHGAGIVQKIEERKILGETKKYYVLKLPCSDMDVMVPIESEDSVGMRKIVEKDTALEAIEVLRNESSAMDSNWNRRYRDNLEMLKTGNIFKVAEVVRNLLRIDRERRLSAGEKKMLLDAKQILVSEIILACEMSEKMAEELVEDAV